MNTRPITDYLDEAILDLKDYQTRALKHWPADKQPTRACPYWNHVAAQWTDYVNRLMAEIGGEHPHGPGY